MKSSKTAVYQGMRGGFEVCNPIRNCSRIEGIRIQPGFFKQSRGKAGEGVFYALQAVLRGRSFSQGF